MAFIYKPKTLKQLEDSYSRRVKADLNAFESLEDFIDWYEKEKKECAFCGLTEIESQEIVITGILTSNRFPQNGVVGQGTHRAAWLEIDRLEPKGKYSRSNCVLSCYFCNNDKSDVFNGDNYRLFLHNRPAFLRQLLKDKRGE